MGIYVKKNMQPELTKRVINECWKVGESKEQGKAKISADGVFSRLEEMEKQKAIILSELPLSLCCVPNYWPDDGSVHFYKWMYAWKLKDQLVPSRRRFEELDLAKDLSLWKKPELQVYLSHYGMKKSGNKPELIKRIEEYMLTE